MPLMDGMTATKKILDASAKPPSIIAVSANVSVDDKKQCFDIGMIDYIEKPISAQKIQLVIIEKLNNHRPT